MLKVCHMFTKLPEDAVVVNVCSNSPANWSSGLSPFLAGPVKFLGQTSLTMENAWQYTKVYKQHVLPEDGLPSREYFVWAKQGFANPRAVRYPIGRGAVPEYSWWKGQKLGYIDARKQIYGPLYLQAIMHTSALARLRTMMVQYHDGPDIWLRDWDGRVTDETFTEVLHNPKRKAGHAFFLKALLEDDPGLDELVWNP
jgi:hypothetical protein